ncbi:hypothetical protein ACYUJ6_12010 [Clostridium sp. JNZ X4-2]
MDTNLLHLSGIHMPPSNATKQFKNNIPLKTISMLLSHSSIEITANIYTHVVKKEKEKSIDLLSNIKTMV